MPFERPTLPELIERTKSELAGRLGLATLVPRGPLDALAKVTAGASHLQHGHLDWIARQIFPDTADASDLDRIASLWHLERKSAVKATGTIVFQGTTGAIVPAGTKVRRADQIEYSTDAAATLTSSSASVAATATAAGVAGNCDAGTTLSLVSPVAGISSPAAAGTGGFDEGVDVESDADLRVRVLEAIRNPPGGGTSSDYETWALAVPGVTRVWVKPLALGPGTVTVLFATDNAPGGSIPTADDVAAVHAALDELRPVTVELYVAAPIAYPVDFVLSIAPDNSTTRAAVTEALRDLIVREGEPGGTLLISHVEEAIGTAGGISDYTITTPGGNVVAPTGNLAQLGTITWS